MGTVKAKYLVGPAECNDCHSAHIYSTDFINAVSNVLGETIEWGEIEDVQKQSLSLFFIASGGSEQSFLKIFRDFKEPYILMTTPGYNSLAASMEIMGYLEENGYKGEILHGTPEAVAKRLAELKRIADAKVKLSKMRLGCIGEPGGLIASDADGDKLREKTGMSLVPVDINELISEYGKGGYPENKYTEELKKKGYKPEETDKALAVYGALKRLIEKYSLDAVTVRCFDLLDAIHTTGCLGLAILNAEGIPAACEGDKKSMISMCVLNALTGGSSFMANPSCMDPEKNEIIFAHCTLPIDMPDSYSLTTHFESGIGVAVTCDIAPQPMTVFKCDDKLERHYAGRAQLIETMHRDNLCRTQMKLKLEDGTKYFASAPISNHHMICKGDYKELIDEFFNSL